MGDTHTNICLICLQDKSAFISDVDLFHKMKVNLSHKSMLVNWLQDNYVCTHDEFTICEGHFTPSDIVRCRFSDKLGKPKALFFLMHPELTIPKYIKPKDFERNNFIEDFPQLIQNYQNKLQLPKQWTPVRSKNMLKFHLEETLELTIAINFDLEIKVHRKASNQILRKLQLDNFVKPFLTKGRIRYWSRLRSLLDKISDNNTLVKVQHKVSNYNLHKSLISYESQFKEFGWLLHAQNNTVLLYKMNIDDIPYISKALKIDTVKFKTTIYKNGVQVFLSHRQYISRKHVVNMLLELDGLKNKEASENNQIAVPPVIEESFKDEIKEPDSSYSFLSKEIKKEPELDIDDMIDYNSDTSNSINLKEICKNEEESNVNECDIMGETVQKKKRPCQIFKCLNCCVEFSTKMQLKLHTELMHSTKSNEQKIKVERETPSPFLQNINSYVHTKHEENNLEDQLELNSLDSSSFKCDTCEKEFDKKVDLQYHEVQHTKRNFVCKQCNAVYRKKAMLDKHLNFHKNGKNYKCDECDKTFGFSWNFKQHVLLSHGKTIEPQPSKSFE